MTSRIYKAILLFLSIIVIGVIGYSYFFGFTFVDGLYMTIITITTVGFSEVQPLDANAKIFTIFLILTSISIYGYVVTVVSEYLSNSTLMEELRINKILKTIGKLEGHTIVCGYGRNGRQAAAKLKNFKKSCVVIERSSELLKEIAEDGFLVIEGDATDDETLEAAGIKNAGNLITALPSDSDNLYVVLSSRQLNKSMTIVSRATNESTQKKLMIAGADNVIMPDKLGGDYMASLVVTPDLIEFVKRISFEGESSANLEEIAVKDLPKEYLMKSIRDLDLRRKTGCSVIGFITAEDDYIINPSSDLVLELNSNLIVLGRPEQIKKIKEIF
ncbi:potassium channel family protein [Flavicella sediminum]|uniref:potassium channel family protein n=1 Tax=Flavicella sediminum TaxID=2585141 RepID=UPI0011204127|nr:potassium channel protein [Flavicella sediminum]